MKRILQYIVLTVCCCFLTSCAFVSQKVRLTPEANIMMSNKGEGKVISLKVTDERNSNVIGHRGVNGGGGTITLDQDIRNIFEYEIARGLSRKGFKVVPSGRNGNRVLKIEIRALNYHLAMGFWTFGLHTKSAIKGIALVNGKSYEKFYKAEDEKRVAAAPAERENEKIINKIVSDVLEKMLNDYELIDFLAR